MQEETKPATEQTKICTTCNIRKPLIQFSVESRSRSGYGPSCKECKNAYHLAWHHKNRDYDNARMKEWRKQDRVKNPNKHLWISSARRAQQEGITFTITPEDVAIPTHCPVLGIPLALSNDHAKMDSPSIDRLIPDLGYVPGNIVVMSLRANSMKNCGTPEQILKLAAWVRKTFKIEDEPPVPPAVYHVPEASLIREFVIQ